MPWAVGSTAPDSIASRIRSASSTASSWSSDESGVSTAASGVPGQLELDDDGVELLAAHVRVVRDDDADLDRAATGRLRMPHDRILPHAHGGIMPRRRSVETTATILAP